MNEQIRQDFPLLQQTNRGKPLIYLDSSVTSQKPQQVIDAIEHYYQNNHANIHRGIYELSERTTQQYEQARSKIQSYIHAKHSHEIIFVRGATEGINLVAYSYGRMKFQPGDEILLSTMEHHSNIVPWQIIAEQTGAIIKVIPISDQGEIDLEEYSKLLTPRTKLVAVTHASNVLGTINPIKKMSEIAHAHGAKILIDGAQAFPHLAVDVQDIDCDFYVFSGHKAYGPTGIGVLYGKEDLLDQMPPYQSGGNMIETVSFTKTTYNQLPYKFEAGTPHIAGVIGLKAAIDYLDIIGMPKIILHEQVLLNDATQKLMLIPNLRIIGSAQEKVGVISFVLDGVHPHDIATILDHQGIAIRAGHHCAMPLMERYGLPATARVSFGLYNTKTDIDLLLQGLEEVTRLFA